MADEDKRYYVKCPFNKKTIPVSRCYACKWGELEEGWYKKKVTERKVVCTLRETETETRRKGENYEPKRP